MNQVRIHLFVAAALVGLAVGGPGGAQPQAPRPGRPGQLERVLSGLTENGDVWARQGMAWLLEREYTDHLLFMATDPRGGTGGGGFYRPSVGRHGWAWLRQRLDKDGDGAVTFAEFSGPREWFEALDKNQDRALTEDDFAWYGDAALAKAAARSKSLFTQIDRDGNGQVTAEEWGRWFGGVSAGKRYVAQDDLIPLFLDRGAAGRGAPRAGAAKPRSRLPVICSYISGDVGSLSEGPRLNDRAPEFTLAATDGKTRLSRSHHEGKRPLVLVFGSFT